MVYNVIYLSSLQVAIARGDLKSIVRWDKFRDFARNEPLVRPASVYFARNEPLVRPASVHVAWNVASTSCKQKVV